MKITYEKTCMYIVCLVFFAVFIKWTQYKLSVVMVKLSLRLQLVYSGTPLKRAPLGPPLHVWNMEVSVIQGLLAYNNVLLVGMAMHTWAVEQQGRTSTPLCCT